MKITKNQKKLINDWSHLVNQQSSNKQLKLLYNHVQNKYDHLKTVQDCNTKYSHMWRCFLTNYNINCKDSVSSHNSNRPHTVKEILKFIILSTWLAKQVQNVRNSQWQKPCKIQQLCYERHISHVTHAFYAIYIACTINAYLQKIEHDYALKQSKSRMQMISGHIGNVL
jgi:hypothetical protein